MVEERSSVSRRQFALGVAMGSLASATPCFMAHGLRVPSWQEETVPTDRGSPRVGRPRLVLLLEGERTFTFSAWLNHGSRRQLALLVQEEA